MWYSDGTIQVAANSTTATGTNTAFLANVRVGDGIAIAGSATLHEVTNIASDLQLTFQPPFTGVAGVSLAYRIAPVQGYVKRAADRLAQVVAEYGDTLAALGDKEIRQHMIELAETVTPMGLELMGKATAAEQRQVIGLGQVDNTPDAEKPVSAPQLQALNAKAGADEVAAALAGKVDKEAGKVLSHNDLTDELYNKLSDLNKTTAQNDTTAGRLLKVGDAGILGAAPPYGGRLNDLTNTQLVYGNPAGDGPEGNFYGWVRHTEVTPGEYSFQEAFDVTGKMWIRALNLRVWSDWDPVLTGRRLDPSTVVKGYVRGSGYVPGPGAVFPELSQDPANGALPYISALEIRETGRLVNSAGPAEWVRPALTFHFGGYTVKRLSLDHNGQLWLGSDRLALVNADFERGANANGEYIKYPDGTLIVWGQRTVTPSSANAVSEHFFSTAAAFNLNFPVACTCSGFNPELTNSYQIIYHRIVATGQAQVRLQFNSNYVQPYGAAFIAIGRWK